MLRNKTKSKVKANTFPFMKLNLSWSKISSWTSNMLMVKSIKFPNKNRILKLKPVLIK